MVKINKLTKKKQIKNIIIVAWNWFSLQDHYFKEGFSIQFKIFAIAYQIFASAHQFIAFD